MSSQPTSFELVLERCAAMPLGVTGAQLLTLLFYGDEVQAEPCFDLWPDHLDHWQVWRERRAGARPFG